MGERSRPIWVPCPEQTALPTSVGQNSRSRRSLQAGIHPDLPAQLSCKPPSEQLLMAAPDLQIFHFQFLVFECHLGEETQPRKGERK